MNRGEDVRKEKAALRRRAQALREGLGEKGRLQASRAIVARLIADPKVNEARVWMVYAPFRGEVAIDGFVEALWSRGSATVLYPAVDRERKEIIPRRVAAFSELRPGAYGILEPAASAPEWDAQAIEAIVVPALAYDRRGFRLGYGGGFYDRFLRRLSPGVRIIGVQYDALLWERCPAEPHDMVVDEVVTEREHLVISPQR